MEKHPHSVRLVTVLVVDEQFIACWGLKHFLETQDDLRVVGEATTREQALELAASLKPRVIILDPLVPGCSGTTVRALADASGGQVLAFSHRETWDFVSSFMAAGGAGFLPKRCPPEDLVKAIHAVAARRRYICPSLRDTGRSGDGERATGMRRLSEREREVAGLVARGFTSRQIAEKLCVTLKTVETHRYRIFKALGIGSRAELVTYVLEHGMLEPS